MTAIFGPIAIIVSAWAILADSSRLGWLAATLFILAL